MISLILQIIALVLLLLASLNISNARVSYFPLGMFFWLLSLMLGALPLHAAH